MKLFGVCVLKCVLDYVLYFEKWIKYSLEEDGIEKNVGMLIGDVLNRYVVFFFIDEICKRKENINKNVEFEFDVVMVEKYVFLKLVIKYKIEVDEIFFKLLFVDGVNIMFEYVIG